ncbi:hypothetical protein DFH07DRAFT_936803 [Mycena maculata]|uniref:Uncharacterized protein n=1 Tax=Mycena maculata TaxID=230809 RepID=A0AAD7K4C4_9AGAR|nr:hypothetical protein DFH07DRAFT_936803 [Mycena maculata]
MRVTGVHKFLVQGKLGYDSREKQHGGRLQESFHFGMLKSRALDLADGAVRPAPRGAHRANPFASHHDAAANFERFFSVFWLIILGFSSVSDSAPGTNFWQPCKIIFLWLSVDNLEGLNTILARFQTPTRLPSENISSINSIEPYLVSLDGPRAALGAFCASAARSKFYFGFFSVSARKRFRPWPLTPVVRVGGAQQLTSKFSFDFGLPASMAYACCLVSLYVRIGGTLRCALLFFELFVPRAALLLLYLPPYILFQCPAAAYTHLKSMPSPALGGRQILEKSPLHGLNVKHAPSVCSAGLLGHEGGIFPALRAPSKFNLHNVRHKLTTRIPPFFGRCVAPFERASPNPVPIQTQFNNPFQASVTTHSIAAHFNLRYLNFSSRRGLQDPLQAYLDRCSWCVTRPFKF